MIGVQIAVDTKQGPQVDCLVRLVNREPCTSIERGEVLALGRELPIQQGVAALAIDLNTPLQQGVAEAGSANPVADGDGCDLDERDRSAQRNLLLFGPRDSVEELLHHVHRWVGH